MAEIDRRVTVPDELAGRRLDQAAATLFADFSRSRLKAWIDSGALTVDGAAAKPRTVVHGGEELRLRAVLEAAVAAAPEARELDVLLADDDFFVIDKPAGLVVHPGAGNSAGTLLNALLHLDPQLELLPRAGLVHRLDKDTTGLLLVARTLSAQKALVEELARREIHRTYHAICQGVLTGGGEIEAPIGRHPRERTRMAVVSSGRPARTRYRLLERFRAHTYCEVALETGRTHQIRVHMAHIRAPLVGDKVYGGRPKLPPAPSEELVQRLREFPRQALHARRLEFTHPGTGERVTCESPLPRDFELLLAALCADAAEGRAG
jgi:23S rRNA pseudouridine1911/1915/1917 synthase